MKTTRYSIQSSMIPSAFNGYKIAHITDLHNRDFHGELLDHIVNMQPDIIVVTGDSIDHENKMDSAITQLKKASAVAPVYFVNGNHERVLNCYPNFEQKLIDCGITVLRNQAVALEKEGQKITLLGMDDPRFFSGGKLEFNQKLNGLTQEIKTQDPSGYLVLLCHRPELIKDYALANVDLAFTGHAHGGQVRLPFFGAFYAPSQGLFPKYTLGVHKEGNCTMVLSRGLGKSSFIPRIFNTAELVAVTLQNE